MKKPLNLIPHVMKISYYVDIPLSIFKDRCLGPTDCRTFAYLEENAPDGIDGIDYNGSYGSSIFFYAENDKSRTAFIKVIHECLTISKRQLPKG